MLLIAASKSYFNQRVVDKVSRIRMANWRKICEQKHTETKLTNTRRGIYLISGRANFPATKDIG